MKSTVETDERRAASEETKRDAERSAREKESTTDPVQTILSAVGLLALFLSLALVVVLPLAEKIIYFYMGSLSFIEKEGLLTLVQALVLVGVYYAYRSRVGRKTKRWTEEKFKRNWDKFKEQTNKTKWNG